MTIVDEITPERSNKLHMLAVETYWNHIRQCSSCEVCEVEDELMIEECEEANRLGQISSKWIDNVMDSLMSDEDFLREMGRRLHNSYMRLGE